MADQTQTTLPRAWMTWPKGWTLDDSGGHLVIAPTREAARMQSLRAAHDAGYYDLSYTDMRAIRCPGKDPINGNKPFRANTAR